MKKKIMFLVLLSIAINYSWAQVTLPHYEAFNYTAGDSLPMHGWIGLNGGDQILITSGSLSYAGLLASTGNKASFDGAGRDFHKILTTQTSGTTYMSYIFQVTSLGTLNATGGYFVGFGSNTNTFGATLWLRLSGAGFNIGINPKTTVANTQWDATVFNINTPIFVVVSYEMVTSPNNDIVNLWINPSSSTFGGSTPPTPTINFTNPNGDLAQIDRIFLRQDANNATPFIDIDEMRIGITWAQVTPAAVGINEILAENNIQILPNPSNGNFYIQIPGNNSNYQLTIFNTLGSIVYSQDNINSNHRLDLSKLDKGIYFIQLKDNNSSVTASKKIVIQ